MQEYSFLDQRGLGRLDGLKFDTAYSQVSAHQEDA